MEFMKFLATKLQITTIDQIWLTYNRKVAS